MTDGDLVKFQAVSANTIVIQVAVCAALNRYNAQCCLKQLMCAHGCMFAVERPRAIAAEAAGLATTGAVSAAPALPWLITAHEAVSTQAQHCILLQTSITGTFTVM
jgi:hypothetical protein